MVWNDTLSNAHSVNADIRNNFFYSFCVGIQEYLARRWAKIIKNFYFPKPLIIIKIVLNIIFNSIIKPAFCI